MHLTVAYRGRSEVTRSAKSLAVSLAPNLRRDKVGFVGVLRDPVRFREAVCALHDVVVSNMKFTPKDRSAHDAYLADQRKREAAIRSGVFASTKKELLAGVSEPITTEFQKHFDRERLKYWNTRDRYSNHVRNTDWELWRALVPCDPVVTVAPDMLFFECFSKDESSYACLTVGRDAFQSEEAVSLGTTNVDYSWALYDHFQELRSYRETRFRIDPQGFEVQTGPDDPGHREEKIDLPPSWLRGFMMIQSAMAMPMRKVPISREGLYGILAFLKRNRAKRSPRAVRFELTPGKGVSVVLEPFEKRIDMPTAVYKGPEPETIRVWGRDRLMLLYRLLPLADGADVYLLGTGLPCFWVVRMGDMRLTLGLSGWTANDWTSGGSALDQLLPPVEPSFSLMGDIANSFNSSPRLTFQQLQTKTGAAPGFVQAGLNKLAGYGQLIHDLGDGVFRWRSMMPVAVGADQLGASNPETEAAKRITVSSVKVASDGKNEKGQRELKASVDRQAVELTMDADGKMVKAKCGCSFFFTGGLRKGPCRHLQALRTRVTNPDGMPRDLTSWYERYFRGWN